MNNHSKLAGKFLTITLLALIICVCSAQVDANTFGAKTDLCSTKAQATNLCVSVSQTEVCNSNTSTKPCISVQQTSSDGFSSVPLDELDQERGLGGVFDVSIIANLEAILTDNYISNSVTGNNTIDTGSFNDAAGVFSIIQNTGNNVIIQDSTIITVTITPN